jgi:outer membrane protein assembly factor BamB
MKVRTSFPMQVAGLTFLALLILTSCAPNWPQFRGPGQDMLASGRKLPENWNDSTNIRWITPMEGASWSSPIVYVNKVFVTTCIPVKITPPPEQPASPPPEGGQGQGRPGDRPPLPQPPEEDLGYLQDIYRWEVSCLDLETGALLWKQVAKEGHPRIKKNPATNYAGETPVTDGKRLYAYFGMTGVYCWDLDGKLLWEKDLGAFKTRNGWGAGASPVAYDGILYVQVDNEEQSFLVALDGKTGDEVWRAERDEKTNYSTPYIWKNRARTELVTGGRKARSYDLKSGEILWELEVPGVYNIPGPVGNRDFLYLGNTPQRDQPGSLFCIRAGARGDITPPEGENHSAGVSWANLDAPIGNPSPLLYEGLIYLIGSRGGQVTCINALSGNPEYQEKIDDVAACWASPWAVDGKICFTDEKGVTQVFKAGRNFELLVENSLDDKFWTSVAVAGDAYLMKGVERLYCIGK